MKFLHAADIHLDSPLAGLERYEGAPAGEIRGATRRALEALVALAKEEQVDFVLIAGDLYDGDWQDYNTGLFFAGQMTRLREASIPVFIVSGNHDAQSRMSRRLTLPENVIVFPSGDPETRLILDGAVAIHGQSYARRDVTDDLSAGYPEPVPGALNIGLLHANIDGRPGHDNYAPTTVDRLRTKRYDYWALGHVHTGEVLSEDSRIVYPGCIQGRHIRETGSKGCRLIEVRDGRVVSCDHRELDVMRWEHLRVDVDGAESADDALQRAVDAVGAASNAAADRFLACRVELTGATAAHDELADATDEWHSDLRARATDISGGRVWIERILQRTRPLRDMRELEEGDHALGDLLRTIGELDADDERLEVLANQFSDLNTKLPSGVRVGPNDREVTDPEAIREMIDDVRGLLMRLIQRGAGP